jgi:hypothetical protein
MLSIAPLQPRRGFLVTSMLSGKLYRQKHKWYARKLVVQSSLDDGCQIYVLIFPVNNIKYIIGTDIF